MAISAYETVNLRKREDWKDMVDRFIEDPQTATDYLVFGMNLDQRRQADGMKGKTSVSHWV